MCFTHPHPQQVSGYVTLTVVKACPPPFCLSVVTPTQHSDGVTLAEGKLVTLLGRIVPESVHQAFVHHPQLLLYTWQRHRLFSKPVQFSSLTDHPSVYMTYHRETENTVCSPPPFLHICLLLSLHR